MLDDECLDLQGHAAEDDDDDLILPDYDATLAPALDALGQKGQEEGDGDVDTSPDLDDSGEGAWAAAAAGGGAVVDGGEGNMTQSPQCSSRRRRG